VQFVGRNGSEVVFQIDDKAVVLDEKKNLVLSVDEADRLLSSFTPTGDQTQPEASSMFELAVAAISDLDIKVFSNNDRLYTIPKSVQAEAKRGLAWRADKNRGGTSVGLNTARTLARGGQIGIRKIRHIAKYFPRHEVDKKGKGYKPEQDGYPSNGRIAWALWGGDAARSWATAIVNRENRKAKQNSITASYDFVMSDYENPEKIQFDSFVDANSLPEEFAPQFYVRIRMDGSGIDRLYKVNPDGTCYVWDDGMWEDLGNVNHDFETYDRSLDEAYDSVSKIHVPVDVDTAIVVAGFVDANPFETISIAKINPEESNLMLEEMDGVDWDMIDGVSIDYADEYPDYYEYYDVTDDSLTAAGEGGLLKTTPAPAPVGGPTNQDGNYTPEERSQKARGQVRDKGGKFAKAGGQVVIGGDAKYTGTIESVNPDNQTVKVKLSNGNFVDVPGNTTEPLDTFKPIVRNDVRQRNLTSGILGEPRVPIDRANATLPERLPQLNSNEVSTINADWGNWASDMRASNGAANLKSGLSTPVPGETPRAKMTREELMNYTSPNAYNDPSLRQWLEQKVVNKDGSISYPNAHWYRPDIGKGSRETKIEGYKPAKDLTPSPGKNLSPQFMQKPGGNLSGIRSSAGQKLTPATSDVPPMYMAIVSPDDAQAVMDLVALIPSSTEGTDATTFVRKPGKWEEDARVLNDLRSPTPPPVVVLDDKSLVAVMSQIDDAVEAQTASAFDIDKALIVAIMAAGGVDKNRGNAEKLRRYWLYGKGAAKIRWNTPGDWTRCVRQLSKYMGPRAKGYCALRHKEATGLWTGDKEHRQMYGKKTFSTEYIIPSIAVIAAGEIRARVEDARQKVYGTTVENKEQSTGAEFTIPLVIPEAVESGDGRKFAKGAISIRELPLPLLWQIQTGEGHNGSVVVGKITHMERTEEGIGNARGQFDDGVYGKEAERLVRGGFIRGVSADMDMFEAKEENASDGDSDGKVGGGKMNITQARVMAVTLVPKPAFQECRIVLVGEKAEQEDNQVIQDGVYVDGVNPLDASALVACGIIAGAIPVTPPKEWFDNPKLNKPTALTVADDGRVFGHIAAWHVDHIGMAFGTKPPRSKSKYAYFHTGVVRTEEGADVPVGQLTLAGGHAPLEASASEAVRHYDDTASAIADVHAGEDAHGIWVAGALRPGTTPEQIRALRASAPSGDWRPIKGSLELVAVCQVNVPGFPIARARVASGQVMALVAAGASVLAQLKHDPLEEVKSRLDNLEAPIVAAADDAKSRMAAMTAAIKAEELSAKVRSMRDADSAYMHQTLQDADTELAVIDRKARMKLAEEGKALKDGSFPIRNVGDLKNAIHAYGRSKPGKRGMVRRHIMKMARKLDKADLIPANWTEAGRTASAAEIVESQTAAGGLDRNRGNAERLRRYWTRGEGAAKIRWGTPGDWKRCVKHLAKYLGPRAKGYCQLRHKEALGFYTATHAKMHKQRKSFAEIDELLGTFITQVSTDDMVKDINEILSEPDDLFDGEWTPEEEIIMLLVDGNGLDEASFTEFSAFEFAEADTEGLTEEELDALKKADKSEQKPVDSIAKYVPGKTQPRDASGKFRQVLARLKVDLGVSGAQGVVEKIEEAENLDDAGNYAGAAKAAGDLISIIDRLDNKALNPESLENVRTSAGELGKVIANLPFAFGEDAEKIRFSDVPPALRDLMENMIDRVEAKIGKEDADVATKDLKSFMSGGDFYSQSELSGQMAKLLRLLT